MDVTEIPELDDLLNSGRVIHLRRSTGRREPATRRRIGFTSSCEDPIDRHSPARHCRFRLGFLAGLEYLGMIGILSAEGANHPGSRIDIPDNECSRLEIIVHVSGAGVPLPVRRSRFRCELPPRKMGGPLMNRISLDGKRPQIVRGIRREGLTTRCEFRDRESHVVGVGFALPAASAWSSRLLAIRNAIRLGRRPVGMRGTILPPISSAFPSTR